MEAKRNPYHSPERTFTMKILKKDHWLVQATWIGGVIVFLFTFAAIQQTQSVQTYVSATATVWSFSFIGVVAVVSMLALLASGFFMYLGIIIASFLYCAMTHDAKCHWFLRTIISAKKLIYRPRWMAELGTPCDLSRGVLFYMVYGQNTYREAGEARRGDGFY